MKMEIKIKNKPKKEDGQVISQWSLAIAMISIIVMASLFALAPQLEGILKTISHALNENTVNSQ